MDDFDIVCFVRILFVCKHYGCRFDPHLGELIVVIIPIDKEKH